MSSVAAHDAIPAPEHPGTTRRTRRRSTLMRLLRRQPLGALGALILAVMTLAAIAAPYIAPHDPTTGDAAALYQPPSRVYWLGTDAYGRDMLSRLLYGARISLIIGFGASALGVFVGATMGV